MSRLIPGTAVSWNDEHCVVLDLDGLSHALIRAVKPQTTHRAPITELVPLSGQVPTRNLHDVSDAEWLKALHLFETLRPLIETPKHRRTAEDVALVAKRLNKSRQSVYNYLQTWQKTGRLSAFIKKERKDKGRSRLGGDVSGIVESVIETQYKKPERPSIARTAKLIGKACAQAGVSAPSVSTVRRIVLSQPERDVMKARYGGKAARERFEPLKGSFPGADFPLAVVQIDHTPVDIILVDEEDRQPIGRAYLTLVLDVCTRVVCGFCITFEKPSALSAALAIAHAILPKEAWLHERDISWPWPVYGVPRKIHVDNAKEFRGVALSRGCAEHNIILENRPKGLPNYGGHIERSFRTFMAACHTMPGTTFSNVQQKADYDSEKRAVMTLREFERWLTIYILTQYHENKNRSTGYPPINLYKKHILGDEKTPGIGQPPLVPAPRRLMMDFFPVFTPTVQNYGIVFDGIHYWEDTLRQWVHAKDPDDPRKKRKFIVAYDPRNLSVVYFYDPVSKEYIDIPYRDKSRRPISVWELRDVKEWIKQDPNRKPNEETIFTGIDQMQDLEEGAGVLTKKARRRKQRRAQWEKDGLGMSPQPSIDGTAPLRSHSPATTVAAPPVGNEDDDNLVPYDIEV